MEAIFFKRSDLIQFDPWIKVFEELRDEYQQFPSEEIEGRVIFNMIMAQGQRKIQDPIIRLYVDRAFSLLSTPFCSSYNLILYVFLYSSNYINVLVLRHSQVSTSHIS